MISYETYLTDGTKKFPGNFQACSIEQATPFDVEHVKICKPYIEFEFNMHQAQLKLKYIHIYKISPFLI